jgi:hypothetical protein
MKPKRENETKPRHFYAGTKWLIPKGTFILACLPLKSWRKLQKWHKNKDRIIATPHSHGVLLLNETKLDELAKKNGNARMVAISVPKLVKLKEKQDPELENKAASIIPEEPA